MANYCRSGVLFTFTNPTPPYNNAGCTNYPNGYWHTHENTSNPSRQIIGYGQYGMPGDNRWFLTSNASQSCIIQTSTAPYNNNIPPLAEFNLVEVVGSACPEPSQVPHLIFIETNSTESLSYSGIGTIGSRVVGYVGGIGDSTTHTLKFIANFTGTLYYKLTASSETPYDVGSIVKGNVSVGTVSGTTVLESSTSITAGEFVSVTFQKDNSGSLGTDRVTIDYLFIAPTVTPSVPEPLNLPTNITGSTLLVAMQTTGMLSNLNRNPQTDAVTQIGEIDVGVFAGAMVFSSDGLYVYVGTRTVGGYPQVACFYRNASTKALTVGPKIDIQGMGAGGTALNMTLSKDGENLYVSYNEGSNTYKLSTFDRDTSTGVLTLNNTIAWFNSSEMIISNDDKNMYIRVYDTLKVYTRNLTTGVLTLLQTLTIENASTGELHLLISKDDRHVYDTSEIADNYQEIKYITGYTRNLLTGALTYLNTYFYTRHNQIPEIKSCISADGLNIYTVVDSSGAGKMLNTYIRTNGGSLTEIYDPIDLQQSDPSSLTDPIVGNIFGIFVSPDNLRVYVFLDYLLEHFDQNYYTEYQNTRIEVFNRNTVNGKLTYDSGYTLQGSYSGQDLVRSFATFDNAAPSPLCVPISATVTITRPTGGSPPYETRNVLAFADRTDTQPQMNVWWQEYPSWSTYPTNYVYQDALGENFYVVVDNWEGTAGGYGYSFGNRLITPNTTQTYFDSHPTLGYQFETTITWGAVYSSTPTPTPTPTPSPTPTSTLSPCAAPANTNTGPFFFPTTKATNDIYSFAGRAWYWNSYAWHRYCGTSTTPTPTPTPGAVAGYILNLDATYPDNTHDYVSSGSMYPIALIEGKPLYTTANGCNSVYYNNAYGKWIYTGKYGEKDSAYQGLVLGISGPSSGDTFPTTGWIVNSYQEATTGVVTISTAPQAVPPAWVDYICLETTGMYSGQVNGAYFSTSTSNGSYYRLDGSIGNPGADCGPELVRNGTVLYLTANGYLWEGNLSYLEPVTGFGETPNTRSMVTVYLNTCGPTTTPMP